MNEKELKDLLKEYESDDCTTDTIDKIGDKIKNFKRSDNITTEQWKEFIEKVVNKTIDRYKSSKSSEEKDDYRDLINICIDNSYSFCDGKSYNNISNREIYNSVFEKCEKVDGLISSYEMVKHFISNQSKSKECRDDIILRVKTGSDKEELFYRFLNDICETHQIKKVDKKSYLDDFLSSIDPEKWEDPEKCKKMVKESIFRHPEKYRKICKFLKENDISHREFVIESYKKYRNILLGIFGGVLLIIFITVGIILGVLDHQVGSEFKFEGIEENKTYEFTYGDEIDFDGKIKFKYKTKLGNEQSIEVDFKDIDNYEEIIENVGEVQEITIKCKGKEAKIKIFIQPKQLLTPEITLRDNMLTWKTVENADKYIIEKGNASNEEFIEIKNNVTGTSYAIEDEHKGKWSYRVKAIIGKDVTKYSDSEFSKPIVVTNLSKVENIVYKEGYIEWDVVEYADSYDLIINDRKVQERITTNKFKYDFKQKTNEIVIIANSTAENTILSKSDKCYIKFLDDIKNLVYSDGFISWDEIDNISKYEVSINGETTSINTNRFSVNKLPSGVYDLTIVPFGNDDTLISKKQQFKVLVNYKLSIEKGVVSWDKLSSDYNYFIKIDDGSEIPLRSQTSFNLNNSKLTSGSHTISLRVAGNHILNLDQSHKLVVNKLDAPTLDIANGVVSDKNKLSNIEYYLNGEVFDGNLNNIVNPGEYKITSRYVIKNASDIQSDLSESLLVTKYNAPVLKLKNGLLEYDNKSLDIKYYVNGHEFDGDLSSLINAGTHNIQAKYVAKDKYHLDSNLSIVLALTKLEAPTITFDGDKLSHDDSLKTIQYYLNGELFDGNIKNIKLTGVNTITAKYIAINENELISEYSNSININKLNTPVIDVENNKVKVVNHLLNVQLYLNGVPFDGDLSKIKKGGNYIVTAKTLSQGIYELTSELSKELTIKKLYAPTIRVQSGRLYYDNSNNTIQYYLDGVPFSGNLSSITKAGNYVITAKYISSDKYTLTSEVSSDFALRKLESPEIRVENGKLLSNCPENTIQYYLDGEVFNGDLSKIKQVGKHIITAIYVGNNSNILNSEFSFDLEINKIATPSIDIKDNKVVDKNESANIEYYLDGVLFDGDLNKIKKAGKHIITARIKSVTNNDLSSEFSEELIINKYDAPTIKIVNNKLNHNVGSNRIQYYLDGEAFDGDLNKITVKGDYTITAKYISNDKYILSSELSNAIIVTKLAIPTITIKDGKLSVDNKELIVRYYLNGEVFDGDLSKIKQVGQNTITAKYIGNNSNILDSEFSFDLKVNKLITPNIDIEKGILVNKNSSINLQYYLDGKLFDGDLNSILKVGTHYITAKNIAINANDLTSEISNTITITKIAAPVIKIEGDKLVANSSEHLIEYYLDGKKFNGNLNSIDTDGLYTITAKYVSTNKYYLASELSNNLNITKLAAPVINIEGGKLVADSSINTIQYYLDGELFSGDLSLIKDAGVYIITARYLGKSNNILASELSNEIIVRKLSKPILRIEDNQYIADDLSKNIEYRIDGEIFDGNLNNIDAGGHTITAQYLKQSNDQLSSEKLIFDIVKLDAPTIEFRNGQLSSNPSKYQIKWYINGVLFDGDLSKVEDGDYKITAQFVSEKEYEISSKLSNIVEIKILPIPKIELNGNEIRCILNNVNVQYYLDGKEFDGNYASIPAGTHIITAKNIASSSNMIDSKLSNELTVHKSDAKIVYSKLSGTRLNVAIDTEKPSIYYDMTIYFYNKGSQIDKLEYKNRENKIQVVNYMRNGVVADSIKIVVVIKNKEGNETIEQTVQLN